MEKFAAALGVCHRPLVWQQMMRGAVACSRSDYRHQGFLHCSYFERGILRHRKAGGLIIPGAARPVVLASAPDTDDAAAEDSEVLPMITTTFMLERKCEYGERFAVVGENPLLGAWDPAAGVPMDWSEDHVWKCQIDLPVGERYEYKFVLTSKKAEPEWQPGPNRSFQTDGTGSPVTVSESWDTTETDQTGDATTAETVSKLVEKSLEETPVVEDALETLGDTASKLVEEVLGVAGESVPHLKEKTLDEPTGNKGVNSEAAPKVAEESEPEKGSKGEQATNPGEKKAVASVDDLDETESPDSKSSKDSSSESSEDEGGNSGALAVDKTKQTSDVPEDSKGFKSFKFDAQPATTAKKDLHVENGQPQDSSSESESSEEDEESSVSVPVEKEQELK